MAAGRLFITGVLVLWLAMVSGCSDDEQPTQSGLTPSTTKAATDEPAKNTASTSSDNEVLGVNIGNEKFTLELALDEDTRFQGLSDRPEIPEHGGMLFVFPDEARREFVMRRCLVPIDIAFLSANGEIVWMHAMQVESDPDTPEYRLKRYDSHYPAQFAIELRDQTLRRLGLKQGDRVNLPLEDLKQRAR